MSDPVLLTGRFLPEWKTYMLLNTAAMLAVTVVGIPLFVVLLPLIVYIVRLQYASMSCEVTRKFLKFRRGVFVKQEKNVPLEQITDLGVVEGPIMRWLGIKRLTVETAGQSSQGPLLTLLAIEDAETFRDQVLDLRDRLRQQDRPDEVTGVQDADDVQREILAALLRIEKTLARGATPD